MSVSILVDFSRMEAAEDFFRQTLYALEAELDRLDANLRTSLSEWTGAARDEYQIAHQRWRAAAGEMTKDLSLLHAEPVATGWSPTGALRLFSPLPLPIPGNRGRRCPRGPSGLPTQATI
jgi:WXG100 family type VII secretion target